MLRLVGGVNKAGGAVATSHEKARVIRAARASHKEMNVRHPERMTAVTVRMASGDCQLCAVARAVMTRRQLGVWRRVAGLVEVSSTPPVAAAAAVVGFPT